MKNSFLIILLVFVLLMMVFIGCKATISTGATDLTSAEEQTMNEFKQLTPEELIEMANIPKNMYERDYLERFISHYHITQKNFDASKVDRLLPLFGEMEQQKNVQSIFSEKTTDTVPTDANAITAIAFYENNNTSIDSAYFDFQTLECYSGNNEDIFFDLNRVKPRSMKRSEADEIRQTLVDLGVISWVNTVSSEEIVDPQAMCLAIRFDDGSLFRVTASGHLYEDGPSHYAEVRNLLLGD